MPDPGVDVTKFSNERAWNKRNADAIPRGYNYNCVTTTPSGLTHMRPLHVGYWPYRVIFAGYNKPRRCSSVGPMSTAGLKRQLSGRRIKL